MTTDRETPALPAETGSLPAAHQAFLLLRTVFTAAPVLFGLDKFVGLLTNWDRYLAPQIDGLVPADRLGLGDDEEVQRPPRRFGECADATDLRDEVVHPGPISKRHWH